MCREEFCPMQLVVGDCASLCPVYVVKIKTLVFANSSMVVAGCRERIPTPHIVLMSYLLLLHQHTRSEN